MWRTVAYIFAGIGVLGLFGIAFVVGRNWQHRLKAAVAHREHLEQLAAGGSAGASAMASSSGNIVNIIDKQVVYDDGGARALGSADIWVPRPVFRRSPVGLVVGQEEVDVLERSSVRKRLEYIRAAVARGDNTDAFGVDHRRDVVDSDGDPRGS